MANSENIGIMALTLVGIVLKRGLYWVLDLLLTVNTSISMVVIVLSFITFSHNC